ncbi:hypothetical protein FRC08_016235 [Ceratobasidium sp. 394]|nr:hypothetical protein FRC08_016235 [Ceratobasidium sp. 394]
MSDTAPASSEVSSAPTRGRGKRGGFGKSVRARGRGKRFTTPAPFRANEEEGEEVDEEEAERERVKYSKRNLGSNAARYEEKEPDPEEEPEPEIDLSALMSRQRLDDETRGAIGARKPIEADDDDIDHSLAGFGSRAPPTNRKDKKGVIEWDESLEAMKQEKEKAEAVWGAFHFLTCLVQLDVWADLKARFKNAPQVQTKSERRVVRQPKLAGDAEPSDVKKEMEDFLDDLLD